MNKNLKGAKPRTLYLDAETIAGLDKLAKRHKSSRSAEIRRLVSNEMFCAQMLKVASERDNEGK